MSSLSVARNLILKDWREHFPFLVKFNSNSLYLIAGIVIIGLEFPSFHKEWYRPTLVIRNLWSLDKGFLLPVMSVELESKGVQFDIKYCQHNSYFESALKDAKQQFYGILQQEIRMSDIIEFVLNQFRRKPCHITPWSMYNIFNMIYGFSEYFDSDSMAIKFYNIVKPSGRKWRLDLVKYPFSSPECWKQLWLSKFPDRVDLITDVNNNMMLSKKLLLLNRSSVIYNVADVDKCLRINYIDRIVNMFKSNLC